AALQNAVRLRPQASEPHLLLARAYEAERLEDAPGPTHLDLSLEHWKLWLKELRAAGPVPGRESAADFKQRLASAEKEVAAREQAFDLPTRTRRFRAESGKLQGLALARLALALGLAKQALDVLERLPQPDPDEARLKVLLLL